jgi:membrane protease YdiL (CAAX protease family)
MFLLWIGLALVTAAVCGTIANALPGVVPFQPPRELRSSGVSGVGFALLAVGLLNMRTESPPARRRIRRVLARARVLTVRLLRDVFGLAFIGGRRFAIAVGVGVLTAFVAFVAGYLLSMIPVLAESVPPTDARFEAVAGAPAWVPPVFFAVYAAAPEELLHRGLLLAVVAVVTASTTNRWVRVAVIVTALIATSWIFGLGHLGWSLLNAVSAGVTGAMFGAVAIATRSMWAAIVAHALFNVLVSIF